MIELANRCCCHEVLRRHARRIGGSLPGFLRYRHEHSRHSYDVAGGHRQFELLVDAPDASVHGLADAPNRLAPAEVLLDSLADGLADRVAAMTRGAPIDRTAAVAGVVAGHMRPSRHSTYAGEVQQPVSPPEQPTS